MDGSARRKAVIALGTFDGMHAGHRALIQKTLELAHQYGCLSVVYTFSNHPMSLFDSAPPLLYPNEKKQSMLLNMGIDIVDMVPFDRSVAELLPQAFIDLLQDKYEILAVVAGFNYTYGKGGVGTAQTLMQQGEQNGFSVSIVPPVEHQGVSVSSTRIRSLLLQGDVRAATHMLKEPYCVSGVVCSNKQIGQTIGFPTANIAQAEGCVTPKHGVYATMTRVDGAQYQSVTNIGTNPTVNGTHVSIETHLLDYSGDLYGKTIEVFFYEYLRGECRFASKQALCEQIARDVQHAKDVLAGY